FTLNYTGSSLTVNGGRVIGTGTFKVQPSGGTASLTGTGSSLPAFGSGLRIVSGIANANSVSVSGPLTIDSGATLSGGTINFSGNTFTNNGSLVSSSLTFGSADFVTPINQQLGGAGSF